MKVLFVISSLNTGGAQRALSNIVTHLPDEWEIDILLNNALNIVYPYRGNLIDLRIREPSDRNNIFYQFKVLVKRFFALRNLKKRGRYNVCISFLDSANIANIATGKKHCKTIISIRNFMSYDKSLVHKCVISALRFFYNRADCVVAVSKVIEDDLVRNLGIKKDIVTTIYNGYPLEEILGRAGQRAGDAPFSFITVGRCEQQKGQWHLIRAFAKLSEKYDNCRLVILGHGPFISYYNRLIAEYGLDGKVLLKGFLDNPFQELINADIFVFPSLWEGFGNAMLEAMVCGLPVISSDFRSGAREILAPDTDIAYEQTLEIEHAEYGIITPVCSGTRHSADVPLEPQELLLLEAMELLLLDESMRHRYGLASKERAQYFSIDKRTEQWRILIEQI